MRGKLVFLHILRSEYFKTALNTAVGNNSKTMDVKEFSFHVTATAVDFMYGIEIPEDFNNSDDLESLLHMADLYLMEDLKDAVGFFIAKDLNKENIFDTSQLADKFRAVALSEQCAKFFFDNHTAIEDEKLAEMKEGTVLASLAKKFARESKRQQKRDSWMTELFGKRPDFKRREDFGSVEDYKGYVMSRIKPRMFVRCIQSSNWVNPQGVSYSVKEGTIGLVQDTSYSDTVTVKWLTIKTGDPAFPLLNQQSRGPYECLELLTLPVTFNC